MNDELEGPESPNLKNTKLSDEDIARFNKEIESEEMLGEKTDILGLFDKFKDLSLTFDQEYYLDVINRYIANAVKEGSKKKFKGYETQFMVVYQVVFNGYNEIDWSNELLPNDFTLSGELRDSNKNKEVFLHASRGLFALLDSELELINKSEIDVYVLGKRNVIEHISINFAKTMIQVFGDDKSLMKQIIEGFNNFEIHNVGE